MTNLKSGDYGFRGIGVTTPHYYIINGEKFNNMKECCTFLGIDVNAFRVLRKLGTVVRINLV